MLRLLKTKFTDPIYMYFLVLLIALPLGWFWHEQLAFLADKNSFFLAAIFFLGALKITPREVKALGRQKLTIALFDFGMLIVLPAAVFIVAENLVPNLALSLLILAAMPTGMAAPLLTEIVGGRQSLALAITVTTSLLAPITIPLMMKMLVDVDVEVNFVEMFFSIAMIIFIPYALAWIFQKITPRVIKKTENILGRISIIILGVLITGVIAQQADSAVLNLDLITLAWYLLVVSVFMAVVYLAGYVFAVGRELKDRITLTIGFANMNFTLAIYLAHHYFKAPEIVLPITVAVVPWFVFIVIIKFLMNKKHS